LEKALKFVIKTRCDGKNILFVGTKKQAAGAVQARAQTSQSFFVNRHWLGGILTNWSTVQASLLQLHRLEREQKKGDWSTLQKKKVAWLQKRFDRLERYLGGLKGIRNLPGVAIIIGQKVEIVAVQECRKLKIPTICRLDTDCDPSLVEIGVPINDDSRTRIQLFLETLLPRIQEGQRWWLSKKAQKKRKIDLFGEEKRRRVFRQKRSKAMFGI
jgi:small subunit ribosomal protein S2